MIIRIEGRNVQEHIAKVIELMDKENMQYDIFTSAYTAVAQEEIEASVDCMDIKLSEDKTKMLAEAFHDTYAWNNIFGDLASEAYNFTEENLKF